MLRFKNEVASSIFLCGNLANSILKKFSLKILTHVCKLPLNLNLEFSAVSEVLLPPPSGLRTASQLLILPCHLTSFLVWCLGCGVY